MDGAAFETYVRTQLAPTLKRGDVIWDNLNILRTKMPLPPSMNEVHECCFFRDIRLI